MPTRRVAALGLVASGLLGGVARAAFPDKPIRLVVPFAPGGGTDSIARALAKLLADELGTPVIVDNKPGGGTIVGSEYVADAPPDGSTLLVATLAHAVNPSLHAKLPYDTEKAFAPVSLIGSSYNVLVVRPDSPYRTCADILAAARAKPGQLTFASQGNGTSAHLAGELFKNLGDVDITHVPYRGAGPALVDLLGGRVDMMFATSAAVAPFVADGRLRAIATTAPEGKGPLPGVPSIAATLPGYVLDSWYALYAPAGTPAPVIDRLAAAVKQAAENPELKARAAQEGVRLDPGPPAALARFMAGEFARYRGLVAANHITVD